MSAEPGEEGGDAHFARAVRAGMEAHPPALWSDGASGDGGAAASPFAALTVGDPAAQDRHSSTESGAAGGAGAVACMRTEEENVAVVGGAYSGCASTACEAVCCDALAQILVFDAASAPWIAPNVGNMLCSALPKSSSPKTCAGCAASKPSPRSIDSDLARNGHTVPTDSTRTATPLDCELPTTAPEPIQDLWLAAAAATSAGPSARKLPSGEARGALWPKTTSPSASIASGLGLCTK